MFEEAKNRLLKITEALYRTTDLMSDAEPLKWALRQNALEALNIVSFENMGAQDIKKLENGIKSMFIKLELAASGTFISKMNFDVLMREYSEITKMLDRAMQCDTIRLLDNAISNMNISDKSVSDIKVVAYNSTGIGNTDRRESIMSVLREKGPSSIANVASLFAGAVSEKTVQRELSSMVASGLIKQEGEKRWRKYYI